MARELRIEYPGAFYHVISRGNTRSRIFKTISDRTRFLTYLRKLNEKYGVKIHAYCLMRNHYHLLMETPEANLTKAMHKLNTSYSNYYNYHNKRTGHLFAGRYKAFLVEKERYALVLSAYIHLNPVKAGLVEKPEDYRWSSYNYYINDSIKPEFVETDFIPGLNNWNRNDYREYINKQIKIDFDPEKKIKNEIIIGSDNFVDWIKDNADKKGWINNTNVPGYKKLFNSKEKEERIKEIFKDNDYGFSKNEQKKITMFLLKEYTQMKLKEIGKEYNICYSAVSVAVRRLKKELMENKEKARKISLIIKSI